MNKKGVTLIELLIVIAIIGILALVAIPGYVGQQRRAARTEAQTNLEHLRLLEEQEYAEAGEYKPASGVKLGDCAKDKFNNIQAIQAEFSGFHPGEGSDLSFSYCIEGGKFINTTSNSIENDTNCFVLQAFGNTQSRVTDEEFWLDCYNNWHFIQ